MNDVEFDIKLSIWSGVLNSILAKVCSNYFWTPQYTGIENEIYFQVESAIVTKITALVQSDIENTNDL